MPGVICTLILCNLKVNASICPPFPVFECSTKLVSYWLQPKIYSADMRVEGGHWLKKVALDLTVKSSADEQPVRTFCACLGVCLRQGNQKTQMQTVIKTAYDCHSLDMADKKMGLSAL